MTDTNLSAFLWSVADLLRGDSTQSEYGRVILPFAVLRRLDCVLAPTTAVLKEHAERTKAKLNPSPSSSRRRGSASTTSRPSSISKHVVGDAHKVADNLRAYLDGFPASVGDIFNSFEFHNQITRLEKAKLLYLVAEKFANVDSRVGRRSARGHSNCGSKVGFWKMKCLGRPSPRRWASRGWPPQNHGGPQQRAKLSSKVGFGFRTVDQAKIALFHRLGDLPVPPHPTHWFWN